MAEGLPVERLRDFLRDLKPGARDLLISELERALLRGDQVPGAELILQELRRTIREQGRPSDRIGTPARLFFRPLEPFLVDDAADHKHRGRIARVALAPIWAWVCRDLAPEEAKAFAEQAGAALAASDTARADELTRAFQDLVAGRMKQLLADSEADQKIKRRLGVQVGTPRGNEDVATVCCVLRARDMLAAMASRLPISITSLQDEQLNAVKALLDPLAGRSPETFLCGLVLVMSRLAAPWQLIRLAIKAAVSDDATRVASSAYSAAVTIVLAEIERQVAELKADLHSGRGVAVTSLLKSIHDAVRGMRTELDLPGDSPWGRQLAAIRTEISNRLKAEVESLPGRVRRLLRQRPAKEILAGSVLDAAEVAETESLFDFLSACRIYAGELAINEMTLRSHSDLRQYLESHTHPLIDGLRSAGAGDRPFRQSQVDAAVRFCAKMFGQDYAATLSKAATVAAQSERKTA